MSKPTVVNVHRDVARIATAKAEGTYVYIGRGSDWGNPFTHLTGPTRAQFRVHTRAEAIESYRSYLLTRQDLLDRLPELRGKVLGCYCTPQPCHGEILAEFVNQL